MNTAIVTGGTGALGRVVASALLNNGVRVAIPVRGRPKGEPLPPHGETAAVYREADISTEPGAAAFVRESAKLLGGVEILVNCAGGYAGGEKIGEVSAATFEEMITANLRTAFLMCSAVLPLMRQAGRGRIISIAAMAALAPAPSRGAYAIAKRGIVTLTETIAEEVKGSGITANAIAPGIIVTPANRASMPGADVARWVTPEEIAALVLFLCSDDARSVSGNALKVYGGV
ncbi:MAG TPA: SDR family oxidoreductase [Bacteroidota bacterium]|nr:SDR family oxidoreductase [Bacteroidota bacterium]